MMECCISLVTSITATATSGPIYCAGSSGYVQYLTLWSAVRHKFLLVVLVKKPVSSSRFLDQPVLSDDDLEP